jgi:hypothetical protein
MMHKVSIPGSFVDDARDGMIDRAAEGDADFVSLLSKIEQAPVIRRGRGVSVVIELTDSELIALHGEAKYKNEYWNTDAYGIKESKSTIASYAAASKRLCITLDALIKAQMTA